MEKLFDLLGLGIPFCLAAATAWVFSWLDSNIADERSQVISSWLRGHSHNKPDLGNLIISAFDRIYTSPLLRFRAFRRSAAISSVIWLFGYLIPFFIGLLFFHEKDAASIVVMRDLSFIYLLGGLILTLPFVILSDYASLFFVRRFLFLSRVRPILASIGAFIIGVLIMFTILILLETTLMPLWAVNSDKEIFSEPDFARWYRTQYILMGGLGSPLGILSPAMIIHLWLPLFALSTLIARLVFWILRAVEKAQWFLKQGDAHPLKAIGIVATIIVFGSAMLVNEAWTVL